MSVRSCEAITELLASTDVVQFKDIQTALDHASRATAFRYLKQVPYQRSYNHNGRYYTRKDSARYDRHGLFSCGDIHFSRDGSVSETLKRLVCESDLGLTACELQALLQVRVQVFLLDAVRHNAVTREKIGGLYVYVHTDNAVRERQLLQRREEVEARENALAVFELDFEANLPIVRHCVRYKKRLLFPSTSEVYGMCSDGEFHPNESNLVLGPISKPRWIYSCSKQLMDRVISAYAQQDGLDYTLFRPFNWVGSGLDSIHTPKEGSSRVVTQFLGHIARGEQIKLVDGGAQRRSFTDVSDGIGALMKIIANEDGCASGNIYNIGNPGNDLSVRELAELMLQIAREFPEYKPGADKVELVDVSSGAYYGEGYQDIQTRVPWIKNTQTELDWSPRVSLHDALRNIFAAYRDEVAAARALLDD